MINTQIQTQSNNFSPFVIDVKNGRLNSTIKTDTRVSPDYFKLLSAQIQKQLEPTEFIFDFPDFNYKFKFYVVGIDWSLDSNEIILLLSLENHLIIKATLNGYWNESQTPNFESKQFNLAIEEKFETPISAFLYSTFWAMLGLSSNFKVHIPDSNYKFSAGFDLPLKEIKKLLEERQIAERLLIIETALGIELPFPHGFIDGKNIESIAFCYHAIIDREFDWFFNDLTLLPPATEENINLFPETNVPFLLEFPTLDEYRIIFDHKLLIGRFFIRIEQAIIDNYDEAIKNLKLLNGEPVKVLVNSQNSRMNYKSVDTPNLPTNAWTSELWKLVNLESKLDEMLLDKYFILASSTLDGLTDEQKIEMTKRPEIQETPRIS